jgi:hypothetical protein
MNSLGTKKDGRLFLTQFNDMKKKENQLVNDFDEISENLLKQIPNGISPKDGALLLQYTNSP